MVSTSVFKVIIPSPARSNLLWVLHQAFIIITDFFLKIKLDILFIFHTCLILPLAYWVSGLWSQLHLQCCYDQNIMWFYDIANLEFLFWRQNLLYPGLVTNSRYSQCCPCASQILALQVSAATYGWLYRRYNLSSQYSLCLFGSVLAWQQLMWHKALHIIPRWILVFLYFFKCSAILCNTVKFLINILLP